MKKSFKGIGAILIAMFAVLSTLTLSACSSEPNKVIIDGITYRNGFYGDLWPDNISLKGDPIKVGNVEFHHVDCEKFDWVHSAIGDKTAGVLFCSESQWKEAYKYYADSDNFIYYCSIGDGYVDRDPIIASIPDIDSEKFNELMAFSEKNRYDPFDSDKKVKTRHLPIPDRDEAPSFIFYRDSKDGFFTSYQGYKYHVVDGKLLLVYFYDYGFGEYEELVAVDVPDELGEYFIELYESIIQY